MNDRNTEQQIHYLEEICVRLHRAGFETQPLEDSQMPVYWNGVPLCRITGKGSVFYRRTREYMLAMETAPQLKASGLEGDYRILADFNGTVLAGTHSKHGVQFVTWDWDYNRTGVSHGHYFMEDYDGAKRDFAIRSGLIHKEQLFSPEQMTEIYRCCADSVDGDFFDLTAEQEKVIRSVQQQIEDCVPDLAERIRQQEDAMEQTM